MCASNVFLYWRISFLFLDSVASLSVLRRSNLSRILVNVSCRELLDACSCPCVASNCFNVFASFTFAERSSPISSLMDSASTVTAIKSESFYRNSRSVRIEYTNQSMSRLRFVATQAAMNQVDFESHSSAFAVWSLINVTLLATDLASTMKKCWPWLDNSLKYASVESAIFKLPTVVFNLIF